MPRERMDRQPVAGSTKSDYVQRWRERYEELARALKIDKEGLDDDLVKQPELYHEAGRLYQSAASTRDEAKNDRDRLKGEIDLDIRKRLREVEERHKDDVKVKAPTETQIANMVVGDDKYIAANERYQEWDRLAGQGMALREDFHARGFTLRELANLWVAGYYQTNSAGRSDAMGRRAEEYHRARDEGVGIDRHRRRRDED
jgi:hypothetical protein